MGSVRTEKRRTERADFNRCIFPRVVAPFDASFPPDCSVAAPADAGRSIADAGMQRRKSEACRLQMDWWSSYGLPVPRRTQPGYAERRAQLLDALLLLANGMGVRPRL